MVLALRCLPAGQSVLLVCLMCVPSTFLHSAEILSNAASLQLLQVHFVSKPCPPLSPPSSKKPVAVVRRDLSSHPAGAPADPAQDTASPGEQAAPPPKPPARRGRPPNSSRPKPPADDANAPRGLGPELRGTRMRRPKRMSPSPVRPCLAEPASCARGT